LNGAVRNNWARNFGSLVQTVCGETHSQEKKLDLMQSKQFGIFMRFSLKQQCNCQCVGATWVCAVRFQNNNEPLFPPTTTGYKAN